MEATSTPSQNPMLKDLPPEAGYTIEEFEKTYQALKSKLIKNCTPTENPTAVVLGGQPGAGKGGIYQTQRDRFNGNIVELDLDMWRKFHPHCRELMHDRDNFGKLTNPFVFDLVDRLVAELSNEGYNMIIESSLNNPFTVLENGRILTGLDGDNSPKIHYNVELAVMATDKTISWQGVQARFEAAKAQESAFLQGDLKNGDVARNVPQAVHDNTAANVPVNVDIVYHAAHSGEYKDRNGNPQQTQISNIFVFHRDRGCIYNMQQDGYNPSDLVRNIINGTEKQAVRSAGSPVAEQQKPTAFTTRGNAAENALVPFPQQLMHNLMKAAGVLYQIAESVGIAVKEAAGKARESITKLIQKPENKADNQAQARSDAMQKSEKTEKSTPKAVKPYTYTVPPAKPWNIQFLDANTWSKKPPVQARPVPPKKPASLPKQKSRSDRSER